MYSKLIPALLLGLGLGWGLHSLAHSQSPEPATPAEQSKRTPAERPANDAEESVEIAVRGKLHGEQMAIGGETTGTTVAAKDMVFEVDFSEDSSMQQLAQQLDGQAVELHGSLTQRPTPERGMRWIITARHLQAAGATERDKAAGGRWWMPFDRTGLKRSELDDAK